MSCPTCQHTMQNLGLDQGKRQSFWCPRCGTVKTEIQGKFTPDADTGAVVVEVRQEHQAPTLVQRATAVLADLNDGSGDTSYWGRVRTLRETLTGNPDHPGRP